MTATHFDSIAKLFASRRARRGTVASGLGLIVTFLGGRTNAQDATPWVATPTIDPNDPHPSADTTAMRTEFLFVQPFDGGTWAPKDGESGVYTLTLSGAAANTVYFSDRPERVVGLTPMQPFLDGLGFTPNNPPNAALVARREDGDGQEVLVIELLNPAYDADAGTLTYDATVLADYGEPGLAHLARQQTDYDLAESFGAGSLFIDGCSDGVATCYQSINDQPVAIGELYNLDCCWQSASGSCGACEQDPWAERYGKACAEAFPGTCHYGSDGAELSWDCFASDLFCTG